MATFVSANERFVVTSHLAPDGDAVGSVLAFGVLLDRLGKQFWVCHTEGVPIAFQYLDIDRVVWHEDMPSEVDDCESGVRSSSFHSLLPSYRVTGS